MKVTATLRYARISPRKVRAVADLVRGLSVEEALAQLYHGERRAARPLRKLMETAIANAEHNFSLDRSGLRISEVRVDGGPVFKRGMPRGFGRVGLIRHRTSHIKVVLEGDKKLDVPKVKEKAAPLAVEEEKSARDVASRQNRPTVHQGSPQRKSIPSIARRFFRRKTI